MMPDFGAPEHHGSSGGHTDGHKNQVHKEVGQGMSFNVCQCHILEKQAPGFKILSNISWTDSQLCRRDKQKLRWRLATLLEGAGLAFDIQKCLKFQKFIMVVLKL